MKELKAPARPTAGAYSDPCGWNPVKELKGRHERFVLKPKLYDVESGEGIESGRLLPRRLYDFIPHVVESGEGIER